MNGTKPLHPQEIQHIMHEVGEPERGYLHAHLESGLEVAGMQLL